MRLNRIALLCVTILLISMPVLAKEQPAVRKVLRIGGDQSFPPYEFLNANKQPDGYNVELTKAIAEVMGYDVEFRLGKWSKARNWLDNGEVDVIMGMAFSPDREICLFPAPYGDLALLHCPQGFTLQSAP
jgi:polar amino acid transport system substrate-binding protein